MERREKMEQMAREKERRIENIAKKWSRREEGDFFKTVSSYGVDYDRKKKSYDWTRFKTLAKLEKKSDDLLTEYYKSFVVMCKKQCGAKVDDDMYDASIEQISEEKAKRTLDRLELLSKIREEIVSHPKLDDRLKLCLSSLDLPEWWIPGKHDKDLIIGVAKHGLGRTDYHILNDPELSFQEVLRKQCNTAEQTEAAKDAIKIESHEDILKLDKNEILVQLEKGEGTLKIEKVAMKKEVEETSKTVVKSEEETKPADLDIKVETKDKEEEKCAEKEEKAEEAVGEKSAEDDKEVVETKTEVKEEEEVEAKENDKVEEKPAEAMEVEPEKEVEKEKESVDAKPDEDMEKTEKEPEKTEEVEKNETAEEKLAEDTEALEKEKEKEKEAETDAEKEQEEKEKETEEKPVEAQVEDKVKETEKEKEPEVRKEEEDAAAAEKSKKDEKELEQRKADACTKQAAELKAMFPDLEVIQPLSRLSQIDTFVLRDRQGTGALDFSETTVAQLFNNAVKWPKEYALQVRLQHIVYCVENKEWPVPKTFTAYVSGIGPEYDLPIHETPNTPKRDTSTPMSTEGNEVITITTDHCLSRMGGSSGKKRKRHIAIDVETERAKLHALLNSSYSGQIPSQLKIGVWGGAGAGGDDDSEDSRRSTPVAAPQPPPAHQQARVLSMPYDLKYSDMKRYEAPSSKPIGTPTVIPGTSSTLTPIDLSSG